MILVKPIYVKMCIAFLLQAFSLSATALTCSQPNGIIISTSEKKLILCENGQMIKQFYIAIGQRGAGKTRVGDKKTPLGDYYLERPHLSERFGLFIPIDYPTPHQRALGYTGYAVGIHGPLRGLSWLSRMTLNRNWTDGCIAVSSDREIMQIAAWTQSHQPATVKITR